MWIVLRYDCWRDKCKTQAETNADNTEAVLEAKSEAKAEAGGVEQERGGGGADVLTQREGERGRLLKTKGSPKQNKKRREKEMAANKVYQQRAGEVADVLREGGC